ncbi:MAG: hypothetical protein GXO65_02805 [Euryarchaeota archaeon]|nr:hypothetical protein [Euryarchaeota archaeon]
MAEEKEEEIRCASCGKVREGNMVVGKTQSVEAGVRSIYEVLTCTCGNIYRGRVLEQKKLERRYAHRRPG